MIKNVKKKQRMKNGGIENLKKKKKKTNEKN